MISDFDHDVQDSFFLLIFRSDSNRNSHVFKWPILLRRQMPLLPIAELANILYMMMRCRGFTFFRNIEDDIITSKTCFS